MNIRYAKEKEINNIKDMWTYCFNDGPAFMEYYFNNKYNQNNTIVVDDSEEIVSSLQLNQYKILLNDKSYDTSYIVGVSTFPQVRGKGYMKNIMEFTLEELYKKKQLVSILMPIDYRLYRKYGYEHCYDQIEYKIDIEDLGRFKTKGNIYKVNNNHIKDMIEIHNDFLCGINGNVLRDEDYYNNLFKEIKSEGGHIYIHKNNDYEGYLIYFLNGDNMFVREIYYRNINSLKSMLKFIYNHNTQCKSVTISAPINDKIRLVLDNPKTCQIKIKPFMMGRVINLKGYLESLELDTNINISANIKIEDEFIDENNGLFEIKVNNGKIAVKKINEAEDICFSINTISQMAFSYIDIEEALVLNNINKKDLADNVIELFKSIFNKKDNYINEYI